MRMEAHGDDVVDFDDVYARLNQTLSKSFSASAPVYSEDELKAMLYSLERENKVSATTSLIDDLDIGFNKYL